MRVRMRELSGFTLVEVLVVIAIIGLLSTLTTVAVSRAREKAKITKAKHDVDVIYTAIGQLMVDTNEWPGHQTPEAVNNGSSNEVWDLTIGEAGIAATDGLYTNWGGPYMLNIKPDPWGNNYFFDTDYSVNSDFNPCAGGSGCHDVVAVGSFGPNGQGRNDYDSDDIIKIVK